MSEEQKKKIAFKAAEQGVNVAAHSGRVQDALKAAIEYDLGRAARPDDGGFSRGLIFSKAGGFSRGVFFSKSADWEERPDEDPLLQKMAQLDDQAFAAFADRLIGLQTAKQVKTQFDVTRVESGPAAAVHGETQKKK